MILTLDKFFLKYEGMGVEGEGGGVVKLTSPRKTILKNLALLGLIVLIDIISLFIIMNLLKQKQVLKKKIDWNCNE